MNTSDHYPQLRQSNVRTSIEQCAEALIRCHLRRHQARLELRVKKRDAHAHPHRMHAS